MILRSKSQVERTIHWWPSVWVVGSSRNECAIGPVTARLDLDRNGEELNQGRTCQHDGRQSATTHDSDVDKVPDSSYHLSDRREKRDANLQNHLEI